MISSRWFKLVILPLTLTATLLLICYGLFLRNSGITEALAEAQQAKDACDSLGLPDTSADMSQVHNIPPARNAGPKVQEVMGRYHSQVYAAKQKTLFRIDDVLLGTRRAIPSDWAKASELLDALWKDLEPVLHYSRCRIPVDFERTPLEDMMATSTMNLLQRMHIRQMIFYAENKQYELAITASRRARWLNARVADSTSSLSGPFMEFRGMYEHLRVAKHIAKISDIPKEMKTELVEILNTKPARIDTLRLLKNTHYQGLLFLKDIANIDYYYPSPYTGERKQLDQLGRLPTIKSAWKSHHQAAISEIAQKVSVKPPGNCDELCAYINEIFSKRGKSDLSGRFWRHVDRVSYDTVGQPKVDAIKKDLRTLIEKT